MRWTFKTVIYDETSSTFFRHLFGSRRVAAGSPAGVLTKDGSLQMKIEGRTYSSARVVWEIFNGPIPDGMYVSYKNGDKLDIQIGNLKLITSREKSLGKGALPKSTGVRNVFSSGTGFYVSITYNRKRKYVGSYKSIEEAITARDAAIKVLT